MTIPRRTQANPTQSATQEPTRKKIRTLLLNANYQPRAVIPVERAFALMFEEGRAGGIGKVEVVLAATDVVSGEIPEDKKVWRTPSQEFAVPLVVALRQMKSPLFDLTNADAPLGAPTLPSLIKRDNGHCLYCLRTERELGERNFWTIDHIVPRWRFARFSDAHQWENIALACYECNNRKGGNTPEEAGMTLHGVPMEPTQWELVSADLLSCQRTFVRWCREGGPVPAELAIAA